MKYYIRKYYLQNVVSYLCLSQLVDDNMAGIYFIKMKSQGLKENYAQSESVEQ